jgi:hypothetical protein
MSSYAKIKEGLKGLSHIQRVAFAALCAQRVLKEKQTVDDSDPEAITSLSEILSQLWQRISQGRTAPDASLSELRKRLEEFLQEDEDDDRYSSLTFSASTSLSLVFAAITEPEKDAKHAASACSDTNTVFTYLYEEADKVSRAELSWELKAIDMMAADGSTPPTPETFASIPEYERGSRDPDSL